MASTSSNNGFSSPADGILAINSMIPRCVKCGCQFDLNERMPFIISCSHTFCWACMTRVDRRRKPRRCPICFAKYSKSQVNLGILNIILKVKTIASGMTNCNECLRLVPTQYLRRCVGCEQEVFARTAISRVSCVICLECVLDYHKDHDLHPYQRRPTVSPSPKSTPSSFKSTPSSSSSSSSSKSTPRSSSSSARHTARRSNTSSSLLSGAKATPKSRRIPTTTTTRINTPPKSETFLQKVFAAPQRIATNFAAEFPSTRKAGSVCEFLKERLRLLRKRKSMNSRNFFEVFDASPAGRRFDAPKSEKKENFWWSIGRQAATTPPFLLNRVSADAAVHRKYRRDIPHQSKVDVKVGRPSSATSSAFQLLAGDLLLNPSQQESVDRFDVENLNCQSSRQLFYSNAEFLDYVNLLKSEKASRLAANNFSFNGGADSALPYSNAAGGATMRSRKRSCANVRKSSAPPRTSGARAAVPLNYSKIMYAYGAHV